MEKKAYIPLRLLTLCLVLMMLTGTASAEGLFPSMNQMFGTAMPSIGAALGRTADETGENTDGKYEVYLGRQQQHEIQSNTDSLRTKGRCMDERQ